MHEVTGNGSYAKKTPRGYKETLNEPTRPITPINRLELAQVDRKTRSFTKLLNYGT